MSDANIALLSRKQSARSGHRGTVTRLINSVSAAVREDIVDIDQLSLNRRMLEEKMDALKTLHVEASTPCSRRRAGRGDQGG